MALVVADRVQETTTTTGTGTYTLAGAKDGFQSFAAVGDGNTTYYACTDGTDYEVGIGTYTASGTTLARTTIIESSNSDAAVNWSAGSKDIFVTLPASKATVLDASGNATFTGDVTFEGATAARDIVFDRSDNALKFADAAQAKFGTDSDLLVFHTGGNSFIDNYSGNLYIRQHVDNLDVIIRSDNGAGGTTNYIVADGSTGEVQLDHYGSEKFATKSTGVQITGDITVSGTVDGRDVATDGTKLDGIEAGADVTDATNVQAAGALMDSELAYEAAVKAIDQDLSTTGIVQFLSVQAPTVYIPNAGGSGLLFEGSTADTYETSVVATDPTADRTITLPDSDGTVVLLDSLGDLTFEMADANKNIVFDKSANSLWFRRPTGSDAYGKTAELQFNTFRTAKIFDEDTIGASNNGFNIVDSSKIHFDAPNITYRDGDASGEETLEINFVRSGTSYSWNQYHQPEFNPSTHPTFCWNYYNLYTAVAAEIVYTVDYGSNTSFDANGLEFILDKEQDTVANNDDIALIIFRGNNSVAGNHAYAKITATMQDVTDDTEDGILKFSVSRDGSFADYFQLDGEGNHTLFFKPIAFEGSTADAFETTLDVVDPTQDNTLNLPNESGTIATRAHAVALASVLG